MQIKKTIPTRYFRDFTPTDRKKDIAKTLRGQNVVRFEPVVLGGD